MKILQEFRGAVSEYGLSKKSSACFGQHTAYGEAELEVALCETGRTRWGFGVPDCIALSSVRTWRTWCCKKAIRKERVAQGSHKEIMSHALWWCSWVSMHMPVRQTWYSPWAGSKCDSSLSPFYSSMHTATATQPASNQRVTNTLSPNFASSIRKLP